ncbi:unnamed protein product [Closterium sp. NIES-53]
MLQLPTFTASLATNALSSLEESAAVSAAGGQKRGKGGKRGGKAGGGGGGSGVGSGGGGVPSTPGAGGTGGGSGLVGSRGGGAAFGGHAGYSSAPSSIAHDFIPSSADPSLFVLCGSILFFVLVYVDDLVFATPDRHALASVKEELQRRNTCTDLGELQRYLGLQITRDTAARTITLA